ncbi:hypothetical protein [Pediococcus ethanolidurans]|uniref:hypothetical protein n=1 Tax=Pediococcus ethanolidurans TaxID=319653 RepID=UPI001C1F1B2B|nr:hypothetical protein [Pediococcus ethanolidurans]MBU7554511.1 hypothetical protein [Pediococcus ethanolidurans]MBU7563086.1 hypothetical protein [Pediococcus ethanolidurans]MCT4397192.1 hypothetical protein [Pediococcus ethanolidurans]MCV3315096.1 hypothetical protein [Pediococcus ethanolidurans]MCV3320846.1 hypothetical protein [Pediococcus ethanolidurans]
MENLQQNHNRMTRFVQNSYQKLFSEPSLNGIEPQMPLFQVNSFLNQAINKNYTVTIQINANETIYETTGTLTKITDERFILTNSHKNVTYLLGNADIRFIKKL